MPIDQAALAATLMRLLRENGRPIQLKQFVPDYDPAAALADSTETISSGFAARLGFKYGEVDGVRVLYTDRKFIVGAENMPEPKPGDHVKFDGDEWLQVFDVDVIKPAAVTIGYTVLTRSFGVTEEL